MLPREQLAIMACVEIEFAKHNTRRNIDMPRHKPHKKSSERSLQLGFLFRIEVKSRNSDVEQPLNLLDRPHFGS